MAVHSKLIITKCLSNNPTPCANNLYSVNCTTEEVLTLVILLQACFVLLYVTIDRRLWFECWTMVSKLQTMLCDKFNTMQLIEVNSALIEQRTVLLSFNVLWLKPLKIIINYFRPPKIKTYITYYYSFKIFPRFWLTKSTRLIHHNQLLMTKFGTILTLTRKWLQKCSILTG